MTRRRRPRWREYRFEEADTHEAMLTAPPDSCDMEWYLLWWDDRGATAAEVAGLRSENFAETRE